MSFRATITGSEKQLIWGRCLATISQINPEIFLTITDDGIIMSAMNATDTTMVKVRFPKQLFADYYFDPRKIVFGEVGAQQIIDCNERLHTIYSVKLNGKYLSLLSLKQEDVMREYTITIDNCEGCSETIVNKLIVKIRTDSLITKEYQVNCEPLKTDQIILSLKYKQKFLSVYSGSNKELTQNKNLDPRLMDYFKTVERELKVDMFNKGIADENDQVSTTRSKKKLTIVDEINFLSVDQAIFRNFIDSIMSNVIEEIKLELTMSKLNIIGFTKAVYNLKSQEYLKNAVTVTNSSSSKDLEHYCIFSTERNDEGTASSKKQEVKKSIIFKLRDFKIFLNVLNCWKTSDVIRIWFCQPGDPILFEINKDGVILELVQITDSEGRLEDPEEAENPTSISPQKTISPIKKDNLVKSEKIQKELNINRPEHSHTKRSLFITDDDNEDEEQFKFRRWNNPVSTASKSDGKLNGTLAAVENDGMPALPERHFDDPAKRMKTTVEWGTSLGIEKLATSDPRELDKLQYLTELKKQKLASEEELEDFNDSMGPTQTDKPKGLFDM